MLAVVPVETKILEVFVFLSLIMIISGIGFLVGSLVTGKIWKNTVRDIKKIHADSNKNIDKIHQEHIEFLEEMNDFWIRDSKYWMDRAMYWFYQYLEKD